MSLINRLPLTPADYAAFERCGISRKIVDDADVFRVDDHEGAQMVGRSHRRDQWHNYSGLVFPIRWPGNDDVREYRLRRDQPDMEMQADGEEKETAKYLSAPGVKSMLYFAPETDPAWLDDATMPVVFVEGEKKCLALFMLAIWLRELRGADRLPFLPIAVPGVWNWRKTEDGVKSWIADLNRIQWAGRTVVILFDSNVHWNQSVKAARVQFAYLLRGWGAQALHAELPNDPTINGPDDYLAENGPEALWTIIEKAFAGVYPECLNVGEHYALRDWAKMDDIASLLLAFWGFDSEDKETFKAINCTWGGRKTKGFRLRQIDIYKRMQRLPDDATVSDETQAKQFVRRRIDKLLRTIEQTLSIPLVEVIERGGQINPKTKKRLGAKYRVTHLPFLEAKREAERIYADGQYQGEKILSPGRAREAAARIIGNKYLLAQASEKIQAERRAQIERRGEVKRQADDAHAAQISFEKWLQKKAAGVFQKMLDEGFTRAEIKFYFENKGAELSKIGRKKLDKKRFLGPQASVAEELPGLYQNSMGVMKDSQIHDTHNSPSESLESDTYLVTSPIHEELDNSREPDGSPEAPYFDWRPGELAQVRAAWLAMSEAERAEMMFDDLAAASKGGD
jgi:hypothetical protein